LIDEAERVGVSAISCFEASRLVARRRIALDRPAGEWIRQALAHARVRALALDARIAIVAGEIGERFPGDPADRVIYATAIAHRARLVTKDRRLRDAAPAVAVW